MWISAMTFCSLNLEPHVATGTIHICRVCPHHLQGLHHAPSRPGWCKLCGLRSQVAPLPSPALPLLPAAWTSRTPWLFRWVHMLLLSGIPGISSSLGHLLIILLASLPPPHSVLGPLPHALLSHQLLAPYRCIYSFFQSRLDLGLHESRA